MAAPVYVLGGYQTDFARNWTKESKHIVAMIREGVLGGLEATGLEPSTHLSPERLHALHGLCHPSSVPALRRGPGLRWPRQPPAVRDQRFR